MERVSTDSLREQESNVSQGEIIVMDHDYWRDNTQSDNIAGTSMLYTGWRKNISQISSPREKGERIPKQEIAPFLTQLCLRKTIRTPCTWEGEHTKCPCVRVNPQLTRECSRGENGIVGVVVFLPAWGSGWWSVRVGKDWQSCHTPLPAITASANNRTFKVVVG